MSEPYYKMPFASKAYQSVTLQSFIKYVIFLARHRYHSCNH